MRERMRSIQACRRLAPPLALSVAWLAAMAMVGPGAPVAEEPPAGAPVPGDQVAPPPTPPVAVAPASPQPPAEARPLGEAPPPTAGRSTPVAHAPAAEPAPEKPSPAAAKGSSAPKAVPAAPGAVTIADFSFGPSSVTVGVGETVTWTNGGPSSHTATANDGSFDTGVLAKGQSGSATFDKAGSYAYVCSLHSNMTGTVNVVDQAGGDTTDGSGAATGSGPASTAPADSGVGSATSAQLPRTGATPGWLALTGIGLLAIGTLGQRWSRRRPSV